MKYLGGIMKKYLMTLCLAILFTNPLSAFTYRCIEGGMTKAEYHEACNTELILSNKGDYTKEDIEKRLHYGYDYTGSPLEGKDNSGTIYWTEDGLIWRIQLTYSENEEEILKGIALRQALTKKFPGIEIQESTESSTYSTYNYFTVVLVDSNVSKAAIDKIVEKLKPTL